MSFNLQKQAECLWWWAVTGSIFPQLKDTVDDEEAKVPEQQNSQDEGRPTQNVPRAFLSLNAAAAPAGGQSQSGSSYWKQSVESVNIITHKQTKKNKYKFRSTKRILGTWAASFLIFKYFQHFNTNAANELLLTPKFFPATFTESWWTKQSPIKQVTSCF